MHLAAELARIEVVEMLLKAGLDLTLRDRVRIRNENVCMCTMAISSSLLMMNPQPNRSMVLNLYEENKYSKYI